MSVELRCEQRNGVFAAAKHNGLLKMFNCLYDAEVDGKVPSGRV